jgi:hypothetical protein
VPLRFLKNVHALDSRPGLLRTRVTFLRGMKFLQFITSTLTHDPDFIHRWPELNQTAFRPNARTYCTFAAQRSDAIS